MIALKGSPTSAKDQHADHSAAHRRQRTLSRSDFPDFNDPNKLGEGQAMVGPPDQPHRHLPEARTRLSRRTAPSTTTSSASLLVPDAHFATESGKSKGQFYTPSEVSRVIAKVIGISPHNTRPPHRL